MMVVDSIEMNRFDSVQLFLNFREFPVQIKRLDCYPVSAHGIDMIGLNGFIRSGIQQHAGNDTRPSFELGLLVLHIGVHLVEVAGIVCASCLDCVVWE